MKRFLYLICILTVAMACKEVFEPPPQALLQATFYNSSTNLKRTALVLAQGVGVESPVFRDSVRSNMLFPLTIKDTTRYIIWLDSESDSITFIHETTQKYASMETGFYYEYKLLSVRFTKKKIDSIKIVDPLITTKWNENIKLYIKP